MTDQKHRLMVEQVALCEPERGVPTRGMAYACPGPPELSRERPERCGRVAFRNIGDPPQVKCACGMEFNANYAPFIGHVTDMTPTGKILVDPAEGEAALTATEKATVLMVIAAQPIGDRPARDLYDKLTGRTDTRYGSR